MQDMINHPAHYTDKSTNYGGMETIETIEKMGCGFEYCLGNLVKYLERAGKKPGASPLQDMEKAIWYAARAATLNLSDPDSDYSFALAWIIRSLENGDLTDARKRLHRLIDRIIENNSLV